MFSSIRILADATLPGLRALFKPPFTMTTYQNQDQIPDLLTNQDVLLCRSTLRVGTKLLANSTIQCVATASSGTDHIDSDYLQQHNIRLFDAKGSNARSVADYVVATLAALQQKGKLAGVIGVGEVGSRVVERLHEVGFKVICYDPFKAQQDKNHSYKTLADLTACDVICVHANLHNSQPFPSQNLLSTAFLTQLQPGVTIINASRGGIVDEDALLATTTPITYCTDVYSNEPSIDPRIVDFATICTPHIAGHSIEAKQAAVMQVSQQLHKHYGLTMPSECIPTPIELFASSIGKTWQESILNIYNPFTETNNLKTAHDKKSVFLSQRKAHQYRHDFNCYFVEKEIRLLLGS